VCYKTRPKRAARRIRRRNGTRQGIVRHILGRFSWELPPGTVYFARLVSR
jgi:hypothetical protein